MNSLLKWALPPKILKTAEFLVQQATQTAKQFTKEAAQNVEECTEKAVYVMDQCKKYCHTKCAGEEILQREERIRQLQASINSMELLRQQVNAELSQCWETLNTPIDEQKQQQQQEIDEQKQQQQQEKASAWPKRHLYDVLRKSLLKLTGTNQAWLMKIVDCEQAIAEEESTPSKNCLYHIVTATTKSLDVFLLRRVVCRFVPLYRKHVSIFNPIVYFITIAQMAYSIYLDQKCTNDVRKLDQLLKNHRGDNSYVKENIARLLSRYKQELQQEQTN